MSTFDDADGSRKYNDYRRQASRDVTRIARAPAAHSRSITAWASARSTIARTATQPSSSNVLPCDQDSPQPLDQDFDGLFARWR